MEIVFLELPVGWFGDWHPASVRQWLIFITGECEFASEDGIQCRRRASDVVLLDDTTGKFTAPPFLVMFLTGLQRLKYLRLNYYK